MPWRAAMLPGPVPATCAGDYSSFSEFVAREFYDRYGYSYREPYFILSQEFRELKLYQSILQAIAYGYTTPSHIARFCGLDSRHLYPYLESMNRLGIIERELPVLVNTKKGVYRIKDRLFDFWYNFVFPNRQFIELNWAPVSDIDLDPYFGRHFEIFVRQEVIPKLFPGYMIGRWWYGEEEIDIVGYDERSAAILFCECKWGALTRKESRSILESLKKKHSVFGTTGTRRNNICSWQGVSRGKKRSEKKAISFSTLMMYSRVLNDLSLSLAPAACRLSWR